MNSYSAQNDIFFVQPLFSMFPGQPQMQGNINKQLNRVAFLEGFQQACFALRDQRSAVLSGLADGLKPLIAFLLAKEADRPICLQTLCRPLSSSLIIFRPCHRPPTSLRHSCYSDEGPRRICTSPAAPLSLFGHW